MLETVYSALIEDAELVALVGRVKDESGDVTDIPAIFHAMPIAENVFPAVSFFVKAEEDRVFADDVCVAKKIGVQLDVFAKSRATAVFEAADRVMRRLGFVNSKAESLPEPQTQHIAAVYGIVVFE